MKIALVNLGRRGAGPVYGLEIAKRLSTLSDLLSVVSRHAENISCWRESGLRLAEIDTYSDIASFLVSSLDVRTYCRIGSILTGFKPDVLYFPMLHPWSYAIGLLALRTPKVVTLHDLILHPGEKNPLIALAQRMVRWQASRVVVLSQAFVDDLSSKGFPRDRIDVIPLGELSYYNTISSAPAIDGHHPPTILFFGRILPYKDLSNLLDAFSIVTRHVPNARLLIVGSGDMSPYEQRVNGRSDIVVVNRWIPDEEVAAYFRQGDVVVIPCSSASQSGVIPVAYTCKLPVVATAVGGLSEQVESGRTGLLVPPGDPAALAEACITLLTNRSLAVAMGEAGYRLAQSRWGWAGIAEKVYASCRAAAGLVNTGSNSIDTVSPAI